jgi:hypothetical protein
LIYVKPMLAPAGMPRFGWSRVERVLAGFPLRALSTCAVSHSLGWNVFGGLDKIVLAVVTFLGVALAQWLDGTETV